MNQINQDAQSKKLISKYWSDFRSGSTWNFYSSKLRNQRDDAWVKPEEWIEHAKMCIESNTNLIQALEILLVEEKEQYLDVAEHLLSDWHKSGAHDPYYYFDVMARLPKENSIRKEYLSSTCFKEFMVDDGWGYSNSARTALINADDQCFLEFLGNFIDDNFKFNDLSDDVLEEDILPLFIDLGRKSENYVARSNNDHFKEFCLSYFQKDELVIDKFLNGNLEEDNRQIWIGDNIAYYSWVLGWNDVIDELKNKDWYWMSLFSDWWDDYENNNLLVWSLYSNDNILKERASHIMQQDEYNKLDGAIVWERLKLMGTCRTPLPAFYLAG